MNDEQKVSKNRQKKEVLVAEVSDKVARAHAMVFANYEGLTHKQLEGFKKEIKKSDSEFLVAKNTLLKRALGDKAQGQDEAFQNATGAMFLYSDPVGPLKALAKLIKELDKPKIKFGILDGNVLSDIDVLKLASLPSREVLLAQLAMVLNSPIQNLYRALNWNLQKFVMTLDAVAKQKPAEKTEVPAPTTSANADEPKEEQAEEIKAESPKEEAAPTSQPETPAVEEQRAKQPVTETKVS